MPPSSLCVKCKKVEATIDIKFALYCSPCFLEATYHKYRVLLGRCRDTISAASSSYTNPNPDNSKALILLPRNFLDTPAVARATRLLIHFSQLPAIQEPARKNLVDYDVAVPISVTSTDEDRGRILEFIEMIKKEYPLLCKVHLIIIETGQIIPFESLSESQMNCDLDMSGLSNTLKEDLLNLKLLHIQLKLMSSLSIDRALCPDTSTSLASHILTCTCKGRGKFLPWDSALCRSFPSGKSLQRPLKEISDKEIELYCHESNFKIHFTQSQPPMSIDQLTVNFLSNLETENPGTANVVIRTSSKVTTTSTVDSENDLTCPICFAPNEGICESCSPIKEFF